jgi:nifR3 family TIM-barrel protein
MGRGSDTLRARFAANPALLAPMAGVNDPAFRAICKRLGAGLTYTEMISAKGMSYHNAHTRDMLAYLPGEKPVAFQLFGNDPAVMAAEARELEERCGADAALIDINMGCPARKVAGKGDGAALMRDPALAERIIRAVVAAVSLPVTVKFRRGYTRSADTCCDFARMCEQAGAAAVAVHGRTAEQGYKGSSDRDAVGRVAAAVSIPVIASGDVFSAQDVAYYLNEQGSAAVMVARGAQGNPWIFAQARALLAGDEEGAAHVPTVAERAAIAREHTTVLAQLNPRRLPSMRKHIAWYFKGTKCATAVRRQVNICVTLSDYEVLFDAITHSQA